MDMALLFLYLKCFVGILLGLAIHTGLKFNSTKTLYQKSNESFSFGDFIRIEKVSHIINFLCALVWMLVLSDVLQLYPKIELYVVAISVLVGYANSSLVIYVFGAAQKKIIKIIDNKTNIADGK